MQVDSKQISQIESVLFVSGQPVELDRLKESLNLSSNELSELLIQLHIKYQSNDSGLQLKVTADTVQLVTKPENYEFIQKTLKTERKRPLSKAAYEVLAIIAYTQPTTRAELEYIRGVNSVSALQHLLDLGLVEECGRKDVIGNPYLFKTTELFLQTANINSLDELPNLESFKESLNLNNE